MNNIKNIFIKIIICIGCGLVSWFALSYIFFPIKFAAPMDVYFKATMTHMMPLKAFITIVFILFSLLIYERRLNKDSENE